MAFVVSDCYNHRIQVFGAEGNFLFQFGGKGSSEGSFQYPQGVAVDLLRGCLVVADFGFCLC